MSYRWTGHARVNSGPDTVEVLLALLCPSCGDDFHSDDRTPGDLEEGDPCPCCLGVDGMDADDVALREEIEEWPEPDPDARRDYLMGR